MSATNVMDVNSSVSLLRKHAEEVDILDVKLVEAKKIMKEQEGKLLEAKLKVNECKDKLLEAKKIMNKLKRKLLEEKRGQQMVAGEPVEADPMQQMVAGELVEADPRQQMVVGEPVEAKIESTNIVPFVFKPKSCNEISKKLEIDPRFEKLNGDDIQKKKNNGRDKNDVHDWRKSIKVEQTENIVEEIYQEINECKKKKPTSTIFLYISPTLVYIKYSATLNETELNKLLRLKKSERK